MAPPEGPQITIIFFTGVGIIDTAIPRTVAIRLPTVDKDHIASSQLILLSFIDQFTLPILDHKAKVRLQFLTLAGVGSDRC